jgi:hypothetical protein
MVTKGKGVVVVLELSFICIGYIYTLVNHRSKGAESAVKIKKFRLQSKTVQKFPLLSKPNKSSFSINTKQHCSTNMNTSFSIPC